jgi:hypothetical protein
MAYFTLRPGAGNQDPLVANYFLRDDTDDGLARSNAGTVTPPPAATQALLRALAAGDVLPNGAEGQQFARSLGWSPAGPTDANYVGNQLAAGANWADVAFGQVPNQPANTTPTVEMRQLLLQAVQAQQAAEQARINAQNALDLGNRQLALQESQRADNLEIQRRQLDQQASQFAQTFGLQAEEQSFRHQLDTKQFDLAAELGRGQLGLAQRAQGFEEDKYTSELAANPKNLIQSALWQGNRRAGGIQPDAAAFGGNANTLTAYGAGAGAAGSTYGVSQQVPVPATVNALLTRQRVPRVGLTNAQGYMTTLGGLQNNRLNTSNMDAVSLRNVLANPEDAAYLSSVASAQGQDVNTFAGALNQSLPKRNAGDVSLGY